MEISDISKKTDDPRGIVYDCDLIFYIERKKGTITADHAHSDCEVICLMQGIIDLTIGKEIERVYSPKRIEILSNEYNKLVAETDIVMLLEREGLREG